MFIPVAIVIFIFTLLTLVVIHELGHFVAAKIFNIKVLEFGFGLPPRIKGKKWGETLISINWLPFGGFVRLLGEDEVNQKILENERSFAAQDTYKKIIVVAAGVVMNLILCWVLYYIVVGAQGFKVQVPLLTQHQFVGVEQTNEKTVLIGDVDPGSPAEAAGIQRGDKITAFNGDPITSSEELINKTKDHAGQEISLSLVNAEDGSNSRTIKVTPRIDPPPGQGGLGVVLGSFDIANLEYKTTTQKLFAGPIHAYNIAQYSVETLGSVINTAFTKKDATAISQNVAGPIGLPLIASKILSVSHPVLPYLDFVALLSLNLAVVNTLPIPGLDGGRLFFLIIEAVTRKKTPAVIEKYVHTIGFMVLMGLILIISYWDVQKYFSGFY
jgi:regulator of sigma E protease